MSTTRSAFSWIEGATEDNSTAVASRAAPEGGIAHHVTHVAGSFDATVDGVALVLKQGSTELARWYVFDAFALTFASPLRIEPGNSVTLELEASGTEGVIGSAVLAGWTA